MIMTPMVCEILTILVYMDSCFAVTVSIDAAVQGRLADSAIIIPRYRHCLSNYKMCIFRIPRRETTFRNDTTITSDHLIP